MSVKPVEELMHAVKVFLQMAMFKELADADVVYDSGLNFYYYLLFETRGNHQTAQTTQTV